MASIPYFSKNVRLTFPLITLKRLCVSAEQKRLLEEMAPKLLKKVN